MGTDTQQELEPGERPWGQQLVNGHRPVQETWNALVANAGTFHNWEHAVVPGMVQTADYARYVFLRHAELRDSPRDTDEAVRARMKRQEQLHRADKRFRLLVWEAVLYSRICPPSVLAAQLDRLIEVTGLDGVALGIIPFSAPLEITPSGGFAVLDNRLAITEDWHAELWLDDPETVATYLRVWQTLERSAVYGAEAQRVIHRARRSLDEG
ncbi:DUF5753 domain-containing protein [Streptomyces pactum]|uniref:DUF5753 domain-containing protein n=1 Tax=Streptomyces pactum TaxID=68249 RepID=UPI0036F8EA08